MRNGYGNIFRIGKDCGLNDLDYCYVYFETYQVIKAENEALKAKLEKAMQDIDKAMKLMSGRNTAYVILSQLLLHIRGKNENI